MARSGSHFSRLLLPTLVLLALVPLFVVLDVGDELEPLGASAGAERDLSAVDPLPAEPARPEVPTESRREAAVESSPTGSAAFVPRSPAERRHRAGLVLHAQTHQPLANLCFQIRELESWREGERSTTVCTDELGRFALPAILRDPSLTLGHASIPSLSGALRFELEPSTIQLEGDDELIVYAHPPVLILRLSVQLEGGASVYRPSFWIQTDPGPDGTTEPTREAVAGVYDESGEVLTATFLPSELPGGFLLLGVSYWSLEAPRIGGETRSVVQAFDDWGDEDFERLVLRGGSPFELEDLTAKRETLCARPVRVEDWRGDWSHVFQLGPAASLHVTVRDADGEAAQDIRVLLDDATTGRQGASPRSSWDGGVKFDAIEPGLHEVLVVDAHGPARELARESVELIAGEGRSLVIDLEPEVAPRLAVAGVVLSEKGRPRSDVKLRVDTDTGGRHIVKPDRGGHFELWLRTLPNQLTVRPLAAIWEGRYEPAFIECSPGTESLRFTKARSDSARFRLRFEDRRTGEQIVGFRHVTLHVEGSEQDRPDSWYVLQNEPPGTHFLSAPYSPREDLRWVARVPHYETAHGTIPAPAQRGEIVELTAQLTPGFREELRVVAARSGAPIAGATVFDDRGQALGRTGVDGRVTLTADDWPQGLRVETPGFTARAWRLNRDGLTAHWDGLVVM